MRVCCDSSVSGLPRKGTGISDFGLFCAPAPQPKLPLIHQLRMWIQHRYRSQTIKYLAFVSLRGSENASYVMSSSRNHQAREDRSRSPPSRSGYQSRRYRSPERQKIPKQPSQAQQRPLPFRAGPLSKHDLDSCHELFALYLDAQKRINIEDIDDKEVKGRWKSFVKKWYAAFDVNALGHQTRTDRYEESR